MHRIHSSAKHGSTTAGNPPACIAAISAIRYAVANSLTEKAVYQGKLMASALVHHGVSSLGNIVKIPFRNIEFARKGYRIMLDAGIYGVPPISSEALDALRGKAKKSGTEILYAVG